MNREKLPFESLNAAQINLDELYKIAPSCFTEARGADGKVYRAVNFDVLRQLLGDTAADTGTEFYQFTWPGKAKARLEAASSIRKTLRPVPEESVDWDTTENLYIEGDNLEVLKLLQKSYMSKVKMIYIDPPYNTGKDFIYHDDFTASATRFAQAQGDMDEEGNRYRKNLDTNGRFHSDWCSMIYPRLQLARNLLAEDGAIFISINDCEQRNMRLICDEIYGEANFVAQMIWQQRKGGGNDSRFIASDHEYVLIYVKNISSHTDKWRISQSIDYQKRYNLIESDGRRYYWDTLVRNGLQNPIILTLKTPSGEQVTINSQWSLDRVESGIDDGTVKFTQTNNGWSLHHKVYMSGGQVLRSILTEVGTNKVACDEQIDLFKKLYFDYPKPTGLVRILVELVTRKDDIILDFFSGSATTAHAVMKMNAEDGGNRKFIMVQWPEDTDETSEAHKAGYKNICEIGKERIRRAGRKIKEEAGLQVQSLDTGFRVFRVDESNMENVYFQPSALSQDQLDLMLDNVKPDRTDLDLLFGAMLDWGVQLSLPMSKATVDGCEVYTVNDGDLVACFAENITENVITHIADQSPRRVLFRDRCFNSDADKINIFEQFKQRLGWSDKEAMNNIRVI